MAITRLAVSNPSANTDILLYTADRSSLASIIATNKVSTTVEIRVWIVPFGQDSTPANWSYIAYDADITATNSLETFRFPVVSGDKVYVRATTADVSFQILGIYETAADTYVYAQPTQPTTANIGDIWVDTASDVPSIDNTTVYRWSKTAVGGETSLSGIGNDLSILQYIAGYEQVYLNGVLLAKDLDYFATNGTSITGLLALTAGDIVEVISPYAIELTDVYTKSVSDAKYDTKASNGLNLVVPTSVTGGTVSTNGKITISGSPSSITINGVFTSNYDNYKIIIDNLTGTYGASLFAKFCINGSPTSSVNYSGGQGWKFDGTTTGLSTNNLAYLRYVSYIIGGSPSRVDATINNPFASNIKTGWTINSSSAEPWVSLIGGYCNTAESHDGIQFYTDNATGITGGTIRIYGYNNGGA